MVKFGKKIKIILATAASIIALTSPFLRPKPVLAEFSKEDQQIVVHIQNEGKYLDFSQATERAFNSFVKAEEGLKKLDLDNPYFYNTTKNIEELCIVIGHLSDAETQYNMLNTISIEFGKGSLHNIGEIKANIGKMRMEILKVIKDASNEKYGYFFQITEYGKNFGIRNNSDLENVLSFGKGNEIVNNDLANLKILPNALPKLAEIYTTKINAFRFLSKLLAMLESAGIKEAIGIKNLVNSISKAYEELDKECGRRV